MHSNKERDTADLERRLEGGGNVLEKGIIMFEEAILTEKTIGLMATQQHFCGRDISRSSSELLPVGKILSSVTINLIST